MNLRRLRKELQGLHEESAATLKVVVGATGVRGGADEEGVGVPTWQLSPSFYGAFPVLKMGSSETGGNVGSSRSGVQGGDGGGGDDLIAHFDLFQWRAVIIGPPLTPYEGGLFTLSMAIPDNYPFTPVKVHFMTRIFHPNVCARSGAVSLPIFADRWAPGLTIRLVLLDLIEMLRVPSLDYFLNAEATKLYRDGMSGGRVVGHIAHQDVSSSAGGEGEEGDTDAPQVTIINAEARDSSFTIIAREWTRYYAMGF